MGVKFARVSELFCDQPGICLGPPRHRLGYRSRSGLRLEKTGLVADNLALEDRFAFDRVGLAVVGGEEFALVRVPLRRPLTGGQLLAELVVAFAKRGHLARKRVFST